MSQLLEVLCECAEEIELDERLSPAERTLMQTISLALVAMQQGTDVWTLEANALAEDAAMAKRRAAPKALTPEVAAKAKREKASRRRAKTKTGGKRRTAGKATPTRRAA